VGGSPLLTGLGGVCRFFSLRLGGTGGVSERRSGSGPEPNPSPENEVILNLFLLSSYVTYVNSTIINNLHQKQYGLDHEANSIRIPVSLLNLSFPICNYKVIWRFYFWNFFVTETT
jgi:hypothetical protein